MFSLDTYRPPRDKRRQIRHRDCYFCHKELGMNLLYVHASDEMLVVMVIHEDCLDPMIAYMQSIEEKEGLAIETPTTEDAG